MDLKRRGHLLTAARSADRSERLLAVVAAGVTLAAGVAARSGTLPPSLAKPVGVALWCALVYWLVVFARPRLAVWRVCLVATAVGWVVEFLQLTPGPAKLAEFFPPSRWVLGRAFHAWDLVAYIVGAVAAAGLHAAWRFRVAGWAGPSRRHSHG